MAGVLALLATIVCGLLGYFWPVVQAAWLRPLPIVEATHTVLDANAYQYALPEGESPAIVRLGGVPTPIGATSSFENDQYLVLPLYEDLGPLRLVVIEKRSRSQREVVFEHAKFAYAIYFDRHQSDRVWVATSEQAALYEMNLARGEPRLRWQSSEDSHIFALDQAPNGQFYLGTYPGRRCWRLTMTDEQVSAELLNVQHPAIAGATYLYRVAAFDEALFLSYSAPAVLLRHDLRSTANVELLRSTSPFVELQRREHRVWAQQDGQRWRGYTLAGVPVPADEPLQQEWGTVITRRGLIAEVNWGAGSVEVTLQPRCGGMGITALDGGAEPWLFGATYWNTWLFGIDTARQQIRGIAPLPGGSGEFFHSHPWRNRQIIPSYQGSRYEYDVSQPSSAAVSSLNPRLMSTVPQAHYGIASAVWDANTFVYSTFPNYHQTGGQLVVLETPAGTTDTATQPPQERVIPRIGDDLTLGHLTTLDGRLFGGSIDALGAGVIRAHQQLPTIVELDKQGAIVQSWQLDKRPDDVVGLFALDGPRLLCATRRRLYVLDVAQNELRELSAVQQIKRAFDSHVRKMVRYGESVLVVTREFLLSFDPDQETVRPIARLPVDCTLAALGADGGLYLANREQLWVLPRAVLEQ